MRISKAANWHMNVTSGPLNLPFEKVFLRPLRRSEADFIFLDNLDGLFLAGDD